MNDTCRIGMPTDSAYNQYYITGQHTTSPEQSNYDQEKKRPLLTGLYIDPHKETKHVKIDLGDSDDDDDGDVSIHFEKRSKIIRCIREFVTQIPKRCMRLFWEDWFLLAVMGAIMGVFSFVMDVSIQKLRELHFHLFYESGEVHQFLQYFIWVVFTLALVMLAAASCYYISPQAVGSGIPEMKTILRGVVLKEYLTLKTLVAKCIGLVLVLGSGLPIGKEGPLVHVASMVATLLGRSVASFKGAYENESRRSEMLAAACAVGVASTYGAPIGGVLFSIEVTSVFFPLRNYWRGFFAAYCSAIIFRVLAMLSQEYGTLAAFSPTKLPTYDPKEMIAFAVIGIACGFFAAGFVAFHRRYLRFIQKTDWVKWIMAKGRFIYTIVIVVVIASLKCPLGYGEYFAGGLTPREALDELFCNFSWNDPVVMNTSYGAVLMDHWSGERSSIFLVLALYAINMFWMTAVAITLPVPTGVFIPVFVAGAAFGRMCGEAMALVFPHGLRPDGKINPGAYAVVGATAFAGGITHAISSSVVVLEITGQMRNTLPCMVSVLLAIAVCSHFQPSIYDSIIRIKKLPYLPRIPPTSSAIHNINVADIMVRRVHYVSLETTYKQLRYLLTKMPRLRAFPLVDRSASSILLGSVSRARLERALREHTGDDAWHMEYLHRHADRFSTDTLMNTKLNSGATFTGDRAKLLKALFANENNEMRKVKSDEQLHKVTAITPPSPTKSRHRSGPEGQDERYSTARLSSPTLKRAKTWESKVSSAVGSYVSTLSHRLRQSFRFGSTASSGHSCGGDEERIFRERLEWEDKRLSERLNFDELILDPAPFQLVERTSLYKAHALFSLLGLNRAYVTCLGRLVGVVALRELRAALERAQDGSSDRKKPKKRRSKQASTESPSSETATTSIGGTSITASCITPADVVRKISQQILPYPSCGLRSPGPSAPASTVYESASSSVECLSQLSHEAKGDEELDNDVFHNAPRAYFYSPGPSVDLSSNSSKR